MDKITALKILGLVVGCLAKFVTGSMFVFNVYQDAIKDTFNYTQKEVELLSSMLNLGLGVGFLPGMFFDKFGPQWTSALGLLISVSAYLLVWSSTKSIEFYANKAWLMAIYFLLCGFGSVFTYMVALNTNVINFGQKHTGKIVGFLNAFFAGSPSLYSVVYYHIFTHGETTDISNQNFPGFMLFFAISFGVVDLLCVLCMRFTNTNEVTFIQFEDERKETTSKEVAYPDNRVEIINFARREEQRRLGVGNINGDSLNQRYDVNSVTSNTSLSMIGILLNLDFQLFMWMFAFSSSIGLVYANNLTVISGSLHLDTYNDRLTLIIPLTNAILSAGVGLFSDYLKDRLPRLWIMIFACICFAVSQVLVFLLAKSLGFLVLSAILVGTGIAVVWSVGPTIVREKFFVGNLGRNWGITILLAALIGFAAQEAYGAFYDHYATSGSSKHCYGMKCVRGGSAVCIGSAVIAAIFGFMMQFRNRCCPSRTQKTTKMNQRLIAALCVVMVLVSTVTCLPDAMLAPPGRPAEFRSPDQLRRYLKALNDYYAIVGRPRFGRSVNKQPVENAYDQDSLDTE
ncbi:hypothetical protein ACF0H5_012092 [Mactra antiquata]